MFGCDFIQQSAALSVAACLAVDGCVAAGASGLVWMAIRTVCVAVCVHVREWLTVCVTM